MAAFANRKRMINVRSSSSCSSDMSTENGIETDYVSDNSNSEVETVIRYENAGKNSFFGKDNYFPSKCVLKKEFILNVKSRKTRFNEDEEEFDSMPRKRGKCISKNALMARANRMKKKQYLEELEKKLEALTEENEKLREQVKKSDEVAAKQSEEVKYLKGVLANTPEISMLLKGVQQRSNLPVTSSINKFANAHTLKDEFPLDSDFSDDPLLSNCDLESFKELSDSDFLIEDLPVKSLDVLEESASANVGICLHVARQKVSLEFCPTCNNNATAAWQESTG